MDALSLLGYSVTTVAIVFLIYCVSVRKSRPIYNDSDPLITGKYLYKLAAVISIAIGLLLSFILSFNVDSGALFNYSTVALTSLIAFLTVVAFYTDHKYRMFDRVILRIALFVALAFGIANLIQINSEPITVLYAIGIMLSFSIMFVPAIGASDSRAFMVLFAAGIPVLEPVYTYYAFAASVALIIGYGTVSAIRNRTFNVSIPLIPYILLPFSLLSLALNLIHGVPAVLESLG